MESTDISDIERSLAPPTPSITLTDEQQHAVDLIVAWMSDPLNTQFKLGGFAGTGKTTIIKTILEVLRKKYNIVVVAFTGKAVNVLQRKGIPAQTAHSLMYTCEETSPGVFEFFKKTLLDGSPDLIIWDEASMISSDLYKDALSFNKKYLFVGDPGQLEPVGDNPNLMAKPDCTLMKIHRQAENSPIITFATHIRQGGALEVRSPVSGLIIRRKSINSEEALSCDQVIVAKNKTRESFNANLRLYKKLQPNTVVEGEKLICLRNNISAGVFNGMILYVKKIHGTKKSKRTFTEVVDVDCEDETGRKYVHLALWRKPFLQEIDPKKDYPPRDVVYCTYGYVITCHKSQGSEWSKVLIWDEYMPPQVWDMKRWRYTAITRAAKELIYNI